MRLLEPDHDLEALGSWLGLSDHLRKDVGLARWKPERRATGRFYRG
jgi:hypothetical protein